MRCGGRGDGGGSGSREERKGRSVFNLLFHSPRRQVIKTPLKYSIESRETSTVKPFLRGSQLIRHGDLLPSALQWIHSNMRSQPCRYRAGVFGLGRTGRFLILFNREQIKAVHYHFTQTGPAVAQRLDPVCSWPQGCRSNSRDWLGKDWSLEQGI